MPVRWSEQLARIHVTLLIVAYLATVSGCLVLWVPNPIPRYYHLVVGDALDAAFASSALLALIGGIICMVDIQRDLEPSRLLVHSTLAAIVLCILHFLCVPAIMG